MHLNGDRSREFGAIAAIGITLYFPEPLAIAIYEQPLALIGVGFTFAALTGIFFKETFFIVVIFGQNNKRTFL